MKGVKGVIMLTRTLVYFTMKITKYVKTSLSSSVSQNIDSCDDIVVGNYKASFSPQKHLLSK